MIFDMGSLFQLFLSFFVEPFLSFILEIPSLAFGRIANSQPLFCKLELIQLKLSLYLASCAENMSNFPSTELRGKLSIQSCFPEIKSSTNSSSKSFGDADVSIGVECSDDDISLKDAFHPRAPYYHIYQASFYDNSSTSPNHRLQRQWSSPCLTFHEIPSNNSQLEQANLTPIEFSAADGTDAHIALDPSIWPHDAPTNQISRVSVEQTAETAYDIFSFQHPAVPDTGKVGQSYISRYVPLNLAALKGDWDSAREFLALNSHAMSARITRNQETALHIAAGAGHIMFVQELVKLMTPDDLASQNKVGNTALCFAAVSGITEIAKAMISKNINLPSIRGSNGALPLTIAALLGHREMVWYLYSVTRDSDMRYKDRTDLLIATITADLYDVALNLIQHHPQLALARNEKGETALHVLASKPLASASESQKIWQRCIYSFSTAKRKKSMHLQGLELVKKLWEHVLLLDDPKIGELLRTPSRLLFTAAELGNFEFIIVLIRLYPDLIWKVDDQSRSIFHIAVMHRQEKVFNLIYEIGAHKDLIAAYKDEYDNNMLHLAGKLAPSDRLKTDSGAALQLRRELQWFKEIEKIVQPSYREMKNSEGRTPSILFKDEHKGLLQEGEKWMKDTASSCMVVATLIATVMFAAAFTVPGGSNNETGRPFYLHHSSFMVFAISNALALFSSATSILMFLSILTSRYAEEDFLHSLPNRLVAGLASLFLSIATMMVAFGATLFIVLGHDFAWVAIPVASVACVPVLLFALLQFPLLADMISHIRSSSSCFGPKNHLLH